MARIAAEPDHNQDRTAQEWRDDLLIAALAHVPFDGWTATALSRGARDLRIDPGMAKLAFPGGAIDAIGHFARWADSRMLSELERRGIAQMKIRDKITTAIRVRLELLTPHREAVGRALAVLALPQNAGRAGRSLWRTADAMWRAAGDTATDYNHYTKRAILSGVYSATLTAWLGDGSADLSRTWAFLDRRIAGVMQFEKTKAQLLKTTEGLPSLTRFLGRLRYPARR